MAFGHAEGEDEVFLGKHPWFVAEMSQIRPLCGHLVKLRHEQEYANNRYQCFLRRADLWSVVA